MSNTTRWFGCGESQLAGAMTQRLSEIRSENVDFRDKFRRFHNMYTNTAYQNQGSNDDFGYLTGRECTGGLTKNMMARCVDTIVNMLTINRSRARFTTQDANDVLKTRAIDLTQYNDAVLLDQRYFDWTEKVIRDGTLLGTGLIKVWPDVDEGVVRLSHVPLNELFVSRLEGRREEPTEVLHRYVASRFEMMERFPEMADEINGAPSIPVNGQSDPDAVLIIEGFRSEPWKKKKKGRGLRPDSGKHVVSIGNVIVKNEPWPYKVPFVAFRFRQHGQSFYGMGIGDLIIDKVLFINRVHKDIVAAADLLGHSKWQVKRGTEPSNEQLNDLPGGVYYYDNEPAILSTPDKITCQDLNNALAEAVQDCHDDTGINEMFAGGMIPSGARSGRAIQETNNVQSARFAAPARNWEQVQVQVSARIIESAKKLNKGDTTVKLKSWDGTISKKMWKDVDMPDDAFSIQGYSVSTLPMTPQGRIDTVTDLQQMGYIGKQDAFELMGSLDVGGFENAEGSAIRAAQRYARLNMEGSGELIIPEDFMSLEECLKAATQAANQLVSRDDYDIKKLERLRQYISALSDMLSPPPEPQPATQQPGPPVQGNVALSMPAGQLPVQAPQQENI